MLPNPLQQHLQTVKFRYSPRPSTFFLCSSLVNCHQSTCHGPIWSCLLSATGRPSCLSSSESSTTFGQCLWPSSLGDLLSQVRWKGSLTWKQKQLRLQSDPLSLQTEPHSWHYCPRVPHPRRGICISQKWRSYHHEYALRNIESPMCFPRKELMCLKGIFSSVVLMFSS